MRAFVAAETGSQVSFSLQDCRILVAEDEYMLADDLASHLEHAGATVLGPAPSVARAAELADACGRIDGAVLDINLSGETIFAVADRLLQRDVRVVFTTGYDRSAIPERFDAVPRCQKPVSMRRLARSIGRARPAA